MAYNQSNKLCRDEESNGQKVFISGLIGGPLAKMLSLLRLLMVWTILGQVLALDEREYDPQVAPLTTTGNRWWRSFANQVRLAFSRWQPKPKTRTKPMEEPLTSPTVKTRTRSPTSQPEQQFYGALNPVYQMGNF
ncbi:uncharacterized protein LOC108160201 [Drosophila miranda]|uniref:uncharacterized protein LOC108160201 n=1 Tax=Drosophila miranda TaxID=7229 RepID=UPI00143F6FA3|nr:uncharacterized protein LOC108160201 [Drosophila miranda]